MWQTDFPFFRIIGRGWYSLSTVLGDSSRYIIAWKLSPPMGAIDVTETLDQTLAITGVEPVRVKHRPRLLSDNGPAVGASELREYLGERGMAHTRGRPYPPQTLGKIKRHHRTMKKEEEGVSDLKSGLESNSKQSLRGITILSEMV
jgi:putative transposase